MSVERMSLEVYHTLRMLEERIEPSELTIQFPGEPKSINLGQRWDFYIAAADISFMFGEFKALEDGGFIEPKHGKRVHEDWRRDFPEYQWAITEKGQAVLEDPAKWVESPPHWNDEARPGGD